MKRLLLLLTLLSSCAGMATAQTIKHHAYTVYYDAKMKAPDSVSWNLTPAMLGCKKVARVDKFAQDPLLKNGPKPSDFVQLPAYKTNKQVEGAKGHLFSYEDAMCNPTDNTECFYVDQMYWQYQNFNAGDWKTVEVYERTLAAKSPIHVIAGYIGIAQKLPTGLPIVTSMYKSIYYQGKWTCWIMPNLPTTKGHKFDFWEKPLATLNQQTGLKLR